MPDKRNKGEKAEACVREGKVKGLVFCKDTCVLAKNALAVRGGKMRRGKGSRPLSKANLLCWGDQRGRNLLRSLLGVEDYSTT